MMCDKCGNLCSGYVTSHIDNVVPINSVYCEECVDELTEQHLREGSKAINNYFASIEKAFDTQNSFLHA